jgi:hypothetical protein
LDDDLVASGMPRGFVSDYVSFRDIGPVFSTQLRPHEVD